MKQGGCRIRMTGGFTIVETMIVLAVTGMIFLSAAVLINGKEAKVQFTTSIRNVQSQIQQVIGEVQSGYYLNNGNFGCLPGASHQTFSGSAQQGTNKGCIFLGKVLQFGPSISSDKPQPVEVYSITGNRQYNSQEVDTLQHASPTVVPASTTSFTLRYGLTVVRTQVIPASAARATCSNPGDIGFFSSLASYSSGNLLSGSQNVDVYPICGTAVGDPLDDSGNINAHVGDRSTTALGQMDPVGGVQVCFASGTTKQSGLISIGGDKTGELAVNLEIFSSQDCT